MNLASWNRFGLRLFARPVKDGLRTLIAEGWTMAEGYSAQFKVEEYKRAAATLRAIADQIPYDPRRRNQLYALAEGFERAAARIEGHMTATERIPTSA